MVPVKDVFFCTLSIENSAGSSAHEQRQTAWFGEERRMAMSKLLLGLAVFAVAVLLVFITYFFQRKKSRSPRIVGMTVSKDTEWAQRREDFEREQGSGSSGSTGHTFD